VTRVQIRDVDPAEGERLREIAFAAKRHWGYDAADVERWVSDGDFSPEGLRAKEFFVAESAGRVVAWGSLIPQGEMCILDDLWVEPAAMGQGVGTALFQHAVERARQLGARRLEWEAEPNAVGFYEAMGAVRLRDARVSAWGRAIPLMALDLDAG
jgi:GNAT superfamily N-acetyltransferase